MRSRKGIFPAPRSGWVQNASLVEPPKYAAEVLDNIFPTAAGARLRRGINLHATVSADVEQLMAYNGASNKLFAADETKVYPITSPADPEVAPTADISSLTSGDWSYINFGTSGGQYLWMCNGEDSVRHYDGTSWATPSITGVTSADLTQCWVFGTRIFAVEKDTLSAWYLAADSISGAATEFPMTSVFSKGGSLLFGSSWSNDAGDGLDDLCVFVTTQGQVAVYKGADPSNDFALVGVYDIAIPLSKHAHFRAGGDLAIATEDGIVSLTAAVQQDRIAISRSALTFPIEDAWRESVTLRSGSHNFNSTLWHSQQQLMVSVPDAPDGENQVYVCNARTGAWCRYTGYDAQCSVVHNDQLYFGTSDGEVFAAEVGGNDNGNPYTGAWLPKYKLMPSIASLNAARVVYRGNVELEPELEGTASYSLTQPSAPGPATDEADNVWGVGLWGTATWSTATSSLFKSEWKTVYGVGDEVSVWLQATSNRTTAPNIEIVSMEFLAEQGSVM